MGQLFEMFVRRDNRQAVDSGSCCDYRVWKFHSEFHAGVDDHAGKARIVRRDPVGFNRRLEIREKILVC